MKKKYYEIGGIIGVTVVCLILLFFIKFETDKNKDITLNYEKEYFDDWAFYNYGQDINGVEGVEGIDINIFPAWNLTQGDSEVYIGVVDTGIETTGNKIEGHILKSKEKKNGIDDDNDGYIDDILGWDFYNNDNTIYDKYSHDYHGTYIANEILKVAPNVSIIPAKFMEGTKGDLKDAINAIQYVINRGARVVNCSWNFNNYSKELFRLIKKNPNVLFVCAAGNSNLDLDKNKIYPCSYSLDNILTVGAMDNQGIIADISGYGKSVDVLSPGVNIKACLPEGDIDCVEGTSIASAIVTGEAALILSINKKLTSLQVKKIIMRSCIIEKNTSKWCRAEGYIDIGLAVIQAKNYKCD